MPVRWGLTVPLSGVPLPAHAALLPALADAGYTDVWSSEVGGTDAFTPLALASVWAPSLRLGTAIAGVSDGDAEHLLKAFNIKTVRDLGTNKYFRWAQGIAALAD